MNLPTIELQGTLRSDGTLELEGKPLMPPGRVKVTIQPLEMARPAHDGWAVLQRIWAERQALGLQPRSVEEIDSELNAMRDEWEEHQAALERIQEEARQAREKPSC